MIRRIFYRSAIYVLVCFSFLIYWGSCNHAMATLWFLGVGNDGYYTDVEGFWSSLSNQAGSLWTGVNYDYTHLRSNLSGLDIRAELEWLVSGAASGDTVMFYYSGHVLISIDDINRD